MVKEPSKISDARVERSKAKVLAETYLQLSQSGVGGVSIDEVSRKSGVAKTTIYRHWPSRTALLIDACSRMGRSSDAPDSGDTRADLISLLASLADQLQGANWSFVYPSIIDAAERDAEIRALQAGLQRAFMAPFEAVVERGKARGEIDAERSTNDLISNLVGPLFYRRWFSRERIEDDFVVQRVDAVMTNLPGG